MGIIDADRDIIVIDVGRLPVNEARKLVYDAFERMSELSGKPTRQLTDFQVSCGLTHKDG